MKPQDPMIAQVRTFLARMVAMRRAKVWLKGREELVNLVAVFQEALATFAVKRQAKAFTLALVPAVTVSDPDDAERLDLVLSFFGEPIVLDRFTIPKDGAYPFTATAKDAAPVTLDCGETVMVRLLAHFGNPKSHLIELIERHAP